MIQQQLPLDLKETRQARIERIAMLLRGPVSGKVERADVYFGEATARKAEAIARRDHERAAKQVT